MTEWWKKAVFYQIYPRSFQDGNSDGIGDLKGIQHRLSYLQWLGVDCIWLSPIHPSPQADFGYDVSDYCGVDSLFGDLDELECLVKDIHHRGMRLILDGVFNHCSTKHPWFQRALLGEKRDWFHFKDRPNNWASAFGGSAWSQEPEGEQYYLHTFLPEQADLNWSNPDVEDAILDVLRFWLELGVDGFRLDVFNCYHKDTLYPDNPIRWSRFPARWIFPYVAQKHVHDRDLPQMRQTLQRMRQVVEQYDGVLLGETLDELFVYDRAAEYCRSKQLSLAFNFRLMHSRFSATSLYQAIRSWEQDLGEKGWPTWVFSNHDFPRHAERWRANGALQMPKMKLLAALLLMLRGPPCLYYGEEN